MTLPRICSDFSPLSLLESSLVLDVQRCNYGDAHRNVDFGIQLYVDGTTLCAGKDSEITVLNDWKEHPKRFYVEKVELMSSIFRIYKGR